MARMNFLPELRKYLIENGVIYTVRGFDMVRSRVHVEGVGTCLRKPLGEVFLSVELREYVSQSGFATMDEWWAVIRRFIPVGKRMYLYEVRPVKREE